MALRDMARGPAMLAAILLLPLVSMAIMPLYDTSEPRYAEIARLMAESGDWVTPWFRADVPFWGKPPLAFWAQALSMKVFGFTGFAARFPSWLCLILSNFVLIRGLRRVTGARVAWLSAIIYSSSTLTYMSSAAVLTDPFLALGTTLSLVSFARAVQFERVSKDSGIFWRYGFFGGLVIGLMAKGPLAALMIFAPVMVWSVLNRKRGGRFMAPLPWATGLLLTALLTMPWYILAEIKTPGFLDYFIIGEHIRRFLDPGWAGDLYGNAHQSTYGTIWGYWLLASFPWGLMALVFLIGAIRSGRLRRAVDIVRRDSLFSYWLSAALFTPVFFTFSANILWTYLLPSLAGLSVLIAMLATRVTHPYRQLPNILLPGAALVPAVVLAYSAIMWLHPDLRNTERELVTYVLQQRAPAVPLFYLSEPPFSARFYSAGHVRRVDDAELDQLLKRGQSFYLAVPKARSAAAVGIPGEPLLPVFSNRRFDLVKVVNPATRLSAR